MRIKHVLAGVTVVAGGLLLSACGWDFAKEKFTDEETLNQQVSEVRFFNDSGDVKIVVGDTFEVRRTVGYRDEKPGKTYRMDGDALVLEACPVNDCWVDYEVTVPEAVAVSGHLDSGDIAVVGAKSANVEAESGSVSVEDVPGEVNASTQSGSVALSRIGGAVVASAQSGDVSVGMAAAEKVTASTSSGDVDVAVPEGSYRVRIQGDKKSDEVGDDGTGPAIDLRTESGTVALRRA